MARLLSLCALLLNLAVIFQNQHISVLCAKAPLNIAFGKTAYQISTKDGASASRANDGNVSPLFDNQGCSQTNVESKAWWGVDLTESRCVETVIITNRAEYPKRLSDFFVYLTDDAPKGNDPDATDGKQCVFISGTPRKTDTSFKCAPNMCGRYLIVQLSSENESLTLCEVEVFVATRAAGRSDDGDDDGAPGNETVRRL